ncbi:HIT/MYND zinc finger-like protein [Glarea lozoyensis ATCC 20868]|uniref:HIT/MYND zinc finger-like protein n=1 Tax=Glarea lozoyensis (strain ATCC 20868 / MF5171) TaxID=1116229 RepID=S3DVL6_GLAL2|nr:HIT/MYND zinc finger-like protein [Glarea lozoyensis ATCC 20868]EPE30438.1 HIT/MYND zinc finger-like protein [Glarea lozoyensis ATCC 20868]
MSTIVARSVLLEQLQPSICLLRLLAERPANLDELVANNKKTSSETSSSSDAESGEDDLVEGVDDVENISSEEVEKRDLQELRNKVLDRLAEILARYKSDRTVKKARVLDPNHVSSTMMIMDEENSKVIILCAKNEGLNQNNSTDDTDFLSSWKAYMERISSGGTAAGNDRIYMLDIILSYQHPRVTYYLNKLRKALKFEKPITYTIQDTRLRLSREWLQRLPIFPTRSWIDDNGNEFQFSSAPFNEAKNISKAALSAQSLRQIDDEVDNTFKLIDQIVSLNEKEDCRDLLKQLLPSLFSIWRSPRFQASIKAHLKVRLQDSQNSERRQNEAFTALKFLCRIYYSVDVFTEAAETMPIFKSVECIPIPLPPANHTKGVQNSVRTQPTPLEVAENLGLYVNGVGWLRHLEKNVIEDNIRKLRGDKCHVHAEIQLLSCHAQFLDSSSGDRKVHPYIGCSKLCCLLCWLLIRIHGAYSVRGTHEAIMHRWTIPAILLVEPYIVEHQPILLEFLAHIKMLLQSFLNQSYPFRHPGLLAQSSAALSTTVTVLDREKARMEKSQLKIRQQMMMPSVFNDGLLTVDRYDKPGFVTIMGGSLTKPQEMSFEKAEIYKENHIRVKFGMERSDKMPRKRGKSSKSCRLCRKTSNLRCTLCRTTYCSRSCQKSHWSQHVFVCRQTKRPAEVDYLKIYVRKWIHAKGDERRQAQTISELYSDDDLCKTFGFNNCMERDDVAKLLCFYSHMISKMGIKGLQVGVDEELGNCLEVMAQLIQYERKDSYHDCPCFAWFLHRRSFIDCTIPNWAGDFAYQTAALRRLEDTFVVEELCDEDRPLSRAERDVANLYFMLLRDFNNIPDPLSSNWLKFGFCFCTNRAQSMGLAKLYIRLAESGASLEQIAKAYDEKSLPTLMKQRGLDISSFQANSIEFHPPDLEELGIYRLISEVNHTLSGHYCLCRVTKGYCHPKFETHLSVESDGDYGFHGTNTWERWQLFNFYKHVFRHPNFNARKMQEAKRHPDKDKIVQYLDSLVPNFKKKISNWVLGDAMFPKLKAGVSFPNGRPPCWCVMHETILTEGLSSFTLEDISQLSASMQGDEEDGLENGVIDVLDDYDCPWQVRYKYRREQDVPMWMVTEF